MSSTAIQQWETYHCQKTVQSTANIFTVYDKKSPLKKYTYTLLHIRKKITPRAKQLKWDRVLS